jgi:hypothetical protein
MMVEVLDRYLELLMQSETNRNPDVRLSPEEVAAIYKIPCTALKVWRNRRRHNRAGNQGPRFEVCGARKVLYRVKDLEEWLSQSAM